MKENCSMEKTLNLKFKGERTYLHGTDIFNEVCLWLTSQGHDLTDIDFTFHHLATKQLKMVAGALPHDTNPAAVCAYKTNGVRHKVYLLETNQEVIERYPYLEDEIVANLEIDINARIGRLRDITVYSDIEVWVAMTKALHLKVFAHLRGKWLFVRGRFSQYKYQSDAAERSIVLTASFNDKLTRCDALLDGIKVGEIYFSIV